MAYVMLHQKEGINFLLSHDRCLLADEAGLGKTLQVLEAAKHVLKQRDLLVLCPTSVVSNWYAEALKWSFPMSRIHVVGYEYQLLHTLPYLLKRRWAVIVADEAHWLRNWDAQRTKIFCKKLIKGRDSKIWFLSGTPVVKGAQDLHPILSVIEPGKWGKLGEFQEKYCKQKPNQWKPNGIEYYGVREAKVLNVALSKVMISREKAEVLPDLPPKLISDVPLQIEGTELPVFNTDRIQRAITAIIEKGGGVLDDEFAETVQELGLKKVKHVVKFIEDILHPHPIVIFAHHRLVIFDIADALRDKGRTVEVIVGGMDKLVRQDIIDRFQNGEINDLVCSISVAGLGINLFRSSRCVFAEFPWTWAALDQASNRLHRIGQLSSVNVYNLYAQGTFEDTQLKLINQRRDMANEILR